jgi:hypothetical protein
MAAGAGAEGFGLQKSYGFFGDKSLEPGGGCEAGETASYYGEINGLGQVLAFWLKVYTPGTFAPVSGHYRSLRAVGGHFIPFEPPCLGAQR